MSESSKSIRSDLQAARHGKEITGHELMGIARFAEDTRHMKCLTFSLGSVQ